MNSRDEKRERNRTRKNRIILHVDDDELKFIQAKMKMLGIKNREAYLRKMAIDGKCIKYDYSEFESEIRKNNYLISNVVKSINQIAKRVNQTGTLYKEDFQELIEKSQFMRECQTLLMKKFMVITEEEKRSGIHENTPD